MRPTGLPAFDLPTTASLIVGCGGWSKRKTLYGGDQWTGREAALLDPKHDPAKIRAFFIHPSWARRGIGTLILEACENAAVAAGFTRLEMGATLTGVLLYKARGYVALENLEVPLADRSDPPDCPYGETDIQACALVTCPHVGRPDMLGSKSNPNHARRNALQKRPAIQQFYRPGSGERFGAVQHSPDHIVLHD